jgi:16S rRNA G966 N2-methylase RsmD
MMTILSLKSKIKMKRVFRGIKSFIVWLFLEKPRGLDFSIRNLRNIQDGFHGYAATSWRAIENINSILPLRGSSFLDIGSGKGLVLLNAHKLGAKKSTGIEYSSYLHEVAERNFKVLKVQESVVSINANALEFSGYQNYDVYFMFNPFDFEIYSKVISNILEQIAGSNVLRYLICYGDANHEFIERQPGVSVFYEGICPIRGNQIAIYVIQSPSRLA